MQLFLDTITSYIAPHECLACGLEGSILCKNCAQLLPDLQPRCYKCQLVDTGWLTCTSCSKTSPLAVVRACTAYEGFAVLLMQHLKFKRTIGAAQIIADALVDSFGNNIPATAIITAAPTASSRIRQRGYDQSVVIAKLFAHKMKLPYRPLLKRRGQARQTNSSRSDRLQQLQGAYQLQSVTIPSDTTEIIVIDDVITTGATLEAAAIALQETKVEKIGAIAFAYSEAT